MQRTGKGDAAVPMCEECDGPLPEATESGRPRRYCSDRCRSRAHRVRLRETRRAEARRSRQCDIEVAGHRCGRAAVCVLAVDGRELKVCAACEDLALRFLVGQGTSATAVETRRIDRPDTGPAPIPPRPVGQGKVLLIEDDSRVVDALSAALGRRGYEVVAALTGREGLDAALAHRPAVVLLDLGLPDVDGISVLRRLRATSDLPVIITTARGEAAARVLGLETGADDYLVKPYDIGELVARMRRVTRHRAAARPLVYDDGALRVDFELRQVHLGGEEAHFSEREFRLIEVLVRSAGTAIPTGVIVAHVWGDSEVTGPRKRTLAVLVAVLRTKLNEHLGPNAIVAAHGLGYYYLPPNRPASGPPVGYGHADRLLNPDRPG
ncbi:response regulator transcription factor [Lentzea sp. NPDC042327]|uniref:response regulator transcription factor n=1 Tax=Lentzea sp. NPDC042327 TaxID=3154801 RepID=UPI0033FD882D